MKKTRILGIISLILIFTLLTGFALAAETPVLKTTLLRYDPTPAQPSSYITAYVQVENIGEKQTKNARLEFLESYPFSMENRNDKIQDIGKLEIGQIYITDFQIRVDVNAVEGTNKLKFLITDDYLLGATTEKVFDVNILTQDADIDIVNVKITPEEINPGEKAKVEITIKNMADSTLKDISSQLVLITISGSTVTDAPFSLADSISEKSIDTLRGGQSQKFVYNVQSYPTVSPGIYKVPIVIKFFDGTGKEYNKTDYITLVINPTVDIYPIIERSTLTSDSRSGEIIIRIVNRGFGEVKFANLKILKSDDYEILDPFDQVYIGNIDSDDYETAEFKIRAKTDNPQIKLNLDYRDSLNNEYKLEQTLELTLYSAKELGNAKSNTTGIIISIIIIAGIAYWFYRRKKKKK